MLALLATILLIALAFMLPIGLTVFLAVRFVFALTIIKLVTQFITRCPVSAGDAAKAVIYSLFFTALALLALHQSGLDSSFGTLAGFLELAVYFGAQMVAYSMTLNITMITALTVSILTTLIYTCVTRAFTYVG